MLQLCSIYYKIVYYYKIVPCFFFLTISVYADIVIFIMANIKDILFAFSEEIRLRVILLLKDSRICVNCLTDVLSLPQSTISRHLSLLRRTGVAETRKDKLHSYYTLNTGEPFGLLKKRLATTFYNTIKDTEPFKGDFKRLKKVKNHCDADCKICI